MSLGKMGKGGANNKHTKSQGGVNLKCVLRHEHLKNLALWSTGGDTPIPSLATLFGRRLAADGEASDIPHDPDLFSCQRCETILQPSFNCKVRIEKKHMRYKKKKPNIFLLSQNNVVYYCNLCSHHNLKRGTTAKGQMYPPKVEIQSNMLSSFSSPERSGNDQVENKNTPKPMLTLERDRRIRKSKTKKPIEPQSFPKKTTSNKRKRKATTNKSSTAVNFKIHFLLSSDPI